MSESFANSNENIDSYGSIESGNQQLLSSTEPSTTNTKNESSVKKYLYIVALIACIGITLLVAGHYKSAGVAHTATTTTTNLAESQSHVRMGMVDRDDWKTLNPTPGNNIHIN